MKKLLMLMLLIVCNEFLFAQNSITAGQTLLAGQKLFSANKQFLLELQSEDGHLCIYTNKNGQRGEFIWGSMKYGFNNARLEMQKDGNLVVYDNNNTPKWASDTHPMKNIKYSNPFNKPVKLVLENTGNLQLYNSRGTVMWMSNNPVTLSLKNALMAGETIQAGEKLFSANGQYFMELQAEDGHLCIYRNKNGQRGEFVWGSKQYGFTGAYLEMQTDGNLVVYDGYRKARWSSRTHPALDVRFKNTTLKPVKLVLENDGNLQLYNSRGNCVWTCNKGAILTYSKNYSASSNTLSAGQSLKAGEKLVSSNGLYILELQTEDGNLCVYTNNNGKRGQFIWGSMQYGFTNARLEMQTDGNLVVYDNSNTARWASSTHPFNNLKYRNTTFKPVKLVLENNGILKLYSRSGSVEWSSQ